MAGVLGNRVGVAGLMRWVLVVLCFVLVGEVRGGVVVETSAGLGTHGGLRRVTFSFRAPSGTTSLTVAGSFNEWNRTALAMAPDADGVWRGHADLAPGRYEYKYIRNGTEWLPDPDNSPNAGNTGFGNDNSSFVLKADGGTAVGADAKSGGDGLKSPFGDAVPKSGTGAALQAAGPPPFTALNFPFAVVCVVLFGGAFVVCLFPGRAGYLEPLTLLVRPLGGFGRAGAEPRGPGSAMLARVGIALVIATMAYVARVPRYQMVSADLDEGVYVPLVQRFAERAKAGEWRAIIDESGVQEHPRLALMIYTGAVLLAGTEKDELATRQTARHVAVILATLTAFLLALRAPLAGALWALHGLAIQYTAVAYLDSAMSLFATISLLAAERAFALDWSVADLQRRVVAWLAVSAMGAGAAMSCKYLAAPIPIAIGVCFLVRMAHGRTRTDTDLHGQTRTADGGEYGLARTADGEEHGLARTDTDLHGRTQGDSQGLRGAADGAPMGHGIMRWRAGWYLLGYVVLAVVSMVVTDWRLWSSDLPGRIMSRLAFHRNYSTTGIVAQMNYPWYQPLRYLAAEWFGGKPAWMLTFWDRGLVVLALAGFVHAWRVARVVPISVVCAVVFLCLWPTKWPQYIVVVVPGLALLAALGVTGDGKRKI